MDENKTSEMSLDKTNTNSMINTIELFVKYIDSLGNVLVDLMRALQYISKMLTDERNDFLVKKCHPNTTDQKKTYNVPHIYFREWKQLNQKRDHYMLSRKLLPRSMLVSLVSQYDSYLGGLLRNIFIKKPNILNMSEKNISFELLSKFSSIEDAREYILEKEIETILRSSHIDQIRLMEKMFKVSLTKNLPCWELFVEITERRNLFVHTDGIVSSQYLSVCNKNNCVLEDGVKEGKRLEVSQDYYNKAYECIYEIGIKLGHVLWRKLFPDEIKGADDNFINLCYDLIDNKRYILAIRLLDFACECFKDYSNEINKLMIIVNRAQAYKWSGDDRKCKEIMQDIDWSAKDEQFRLADAVLSDNWGDAIKLMKNIGTRGEIIDQSAYHNWPIFQKLQKQNVFLNTYEEIFGESFSRKSEITNAELSSSEQNSEPIN